MRTVEIFSGTGSFSAVMAAHGHSTLTIDNDPTLHPDICADVLLLESSAFKGYDMMWLSPPCQGFSVAAIGHSWTGGVGAYIPKSESARTSIALAKKAVAFVKESAPTWWFIENPRGLLRKMPFMDGLIRQTVTYCQYGDGRMKPTDIWTNATWWKPRPVCKNGNPCHVAAPRGARTGTQGINGAKDRGRIPWALFYEILQQMPK